MPRFALPINNLNGGELSQRVMGRVDLPKYRDGLETLTNFIVMPEGGVYHRPGTRFVKVEIDPLKRGRVIPFVFSTAQAYVLEFGDELIRVYANEGRVLAPTRTVAAAAVEPDTDELSFTDHGYSHNQGPVQLTTDDTIPPGLSLATNYFVRKPQDLVIEAIPLANQFTITGHGWRSATQRPGPFRIRTTGQLPTGGANPLETGGSFVANVYYIQRVTDDIITLFDAATGGTQWTWSLATGSGTHTLIPDRDYARDTFRLALDTTSQPEDVTGAGVGNHTVTPTSATEPLQIDSPFTESDLPDLHYVQSADVLYLTHPSFLPQKISRLGNTEWAVDPIEENKRDGPYLHSNLTETTLTPVATTGSRVNVVASATEGINRGEGFRAADIGRQIRIENAAGTLTGYGVIREVASTTSINIDIFSALPGTGAVETWRLGSWYVGNYPRALSFSEQRLVFAGETDTPGRLHLSETDNFEFFGPTDPNMTITDDNGISRTLATNRVNSIVGLSSGLNLVVHTSGSLHAMRASSNNEAVTPTNLNVIQASIDGARTTQPRNTSDQILSVSRNGRKLLAIRYSFDVDNYRIDDLTLIADHIGVSGLLDVQVTSEPDPIVWVLRDDGELYGITYNPQQQVFGWHHAVLGGSFGGSHAVVESIAVIPSPNEDHDQLWMTVKRTVNGVTTRHVEFLEDRFEDDAEVEESFFIDAGLSLDGDLVTDPATITGTVQSNPVLINTDGPHGYLDGDDVRIRSVEGMTELNQRYFVARNITPNSFTLETREGAAVDGTAFTAWTSGGTVRKTTTTVSAADHLEGETVRVVVDGANHPDRTVVGGSITLDGSYAEVHIGLYRDADLLTPRLIWEDPEGTSMGKRAKLDHYVVRLLRTLGLRAGPALDQTAEFGHIFRPASTPMDSPTPLATGDYRLTPDSGWSDENRVALKMADPLPCTILAIAPQGHGGQR